MSVLRQTVVIMAMATLVAVPVDGQAVRLDEPVAVFPEGFSVVQTVRELPDGRVLVADPLGQTVVAVDMAAGTADSIGRVGQGPEEYRQPDAVWPLPSGRTLLVDLGNGRLTELSSSLEFGDTRPYTIGESAPGRELVLAIPQAVDGAGRVYFRSLGRPGPGMSGDSAQVLRIDLATEVVDSVAAIGLAERKTTTTGGPNNQNTSVTQVPLSPADAWGVAEDGRVVVARAGDYSIQWIAPNGQVTQGGPNDYDAVAIRQGEKEEWAEVRAGSGGGLSLAVTNNNGVMSMSASRGGGSNDDDLNQYDWPDVKPPFYSGRIIVDPSGRAWVRRHMKAGDPPTYDLFGADGVRVAQVEFAVGRRVVGFGNGALYAINTDQFGLQHLEQYETPAG
ncbi:MAG: hypothetical protein ACR2QM_17500 [Longimicrobiales bacterium]